MTCDVIVAGVGSTGSAACHHLTKRGANVLGLERFEVPHPNGAHHGLSRAIRQAYFEHPDYVPLLLRAYELWHDLQNESDDTFFHITGGLYLGVEDGTIVPGSLRSAREHSLDHTILSADESKFRFPAIQPNKSHIGFYEPNAGFLIPEKAVIAHAKGTNIQTGETLISWKDTGAEVEVKTNKSTYTAKHLVITSGAWTAQVAADLGIPLQVTRQLLAWFQPLGDLARFAPDNFPCWYIEDDAPFGHYGFPIYPGDPGLKIAQHKAGEPIIPDQSVDPPRPDEIEAFRAILDEYLPGCAGELTHACTCKYTNSPDGNFIIGPHPRHTDRVSIACGLSGHGFKFSSVIGEILADLALEGTTAHPIDFLSPQRFQTRNQSS
jgi:sarcosine oxidase